MAKCVLDIETEDLDPKIGRIICIGVKDADTGKVMVFFDEDEKQMLNDFIDYVHNKQFKEVIGYNLSFDMRFLFVKCMKYRIRGGGFFRILFTDIMDNMRAVRKMYSYNKPGKLDEWADFILGNGKLPLNGSIKELWEQGKIDEIIRYNKQDLEITYELWKRVQEVL